MFPHLAGWSVVAALVAVTVWTGVRLRRAPLPAWSSGALLVALVLALVTVPLVPSPHVPLRVERDIHAGPDLLSGVPVEVRTVRESHPVPGMVRIRSQRRLQEDRLLDEVRRVEATVPWLLLLVLAGAWLALGVVGRGGVLLLGGLLLLAGCGEEGTPSRAEVRLVELMEMRRTGDVTGAESTFLPEATWDDPANETQYQGIQEIAGYLQWVHSWATGVFLDVVRVHVDDDMAAAEWVLEGVQTAPIPGQLDTVTNRRFQLQGITVVEVQRGAIVRAVDYMDLSAFLLDLGAEITLPGGDRLAVPGADAGTGEPGR